MYYLHHFFVIVVNTYLRILPPLIFRDNEGRGGEKERETSKIDVGESH